MDYPPNSKLSKPEVLPPAKNLEQVTSSEAKRRKKPLGRQFRETFMAGDAQTATSYVIFEVLVPAAKDAIADAGSQWIERRIFGDTRRSRRGASPPQHGPNGYVDYRHITGVQQPRQQRAMSPRAKSRHDFDEIVLDSRAEAEEVIDQLVEIVSKYTVASVADLYALVGITPSHTDRNWGWTDLRGSNVSRVRGSGYLLDLPEPKPLG